MFGKNRLINSLTVVIFILVFAVLTACSQVQNLTISPQSSTNSCVQPSMYCSNGTSNCLNESLAIGNFPIIAKNPIKAPYCMSFTIKNNNSPSQGGSNMQITYPGLVVTGFPNESATSFSLMDPIASGESDVITNQTQTIGNVALFDPNNCATIGGANSVTIQGGQTCTFYLQIISEAYAPNTYPLSLQYSSYNGNVSNTIVANIYEHVVLYGGTDSGLYENLSSGTLPAKWINNTIGAPSSKIVAIINDSYGNLYFASGSQVYIYNGFNLIHLGDALPTKVNSLTFDLNGNLYAGTNGSGIYVYNQFNSTNNWVTFTDTSGNLNNASIINGLTSTGFLPNSGSQYLYATTINKAYKCLIAPSNSVVTSCAFTDISSVNGAPSVFNNNAPDSDNYGLYLGSNFNAFDYIESKNVWQQYTFPSNYATTGNVASVFHQVVSNTEYTYVGIDNDTDTNESAIYNCNAKFNCLAVIQPGSTITVSGNVKSIIADGDGDLFIGGNHLNSASFASTPNVAAAYLFFGSGTTNIWSSVANGDLPNNSSIHSMTISSTLSGQ